MRSLLSRLFAWLRPCWRWADDTAAPVYLGGSVRAELQHPDGTIIDLGPAQSWVIEAGAEIRGSSDRAIVDHLCGVQTWEGA